MFQPFFTTKSRSGNTGLGLAICQRTVEEHGGSLTVRSVAPGVALAPGERFRTEVAVRLPAASTTAPVVPSDAATGTRLRILVVDDEPFLLRSIELLMSAHHEVVCAPSGEAALGLLGSAGPFDVVLCDLMMPGLDGADVFEAIRERDPRLAPRVVFMTGGAFTDRFKTFLAQSTNVRVYKPFATEEVLSAIAVAARAGRA